MSRSTIIPFLITLIFFGTFFYKLFTQRDVDLIRPIIIQTKNLLSGSSLKDVVEKQVTGLQGRYGIYVKNFKTGESYLLNENQAFEIGSLYKLKVMVLTFQSLKDKKISEDQRISEDIQSLNNYFDISPEDAELTEGSVNFTVKSALEQMITISHNYAAMSLTKLLKANDLAGNITPKEIAKFFENLYTGNIIDKENSEGMLDLLKRQQINNRIPKYLPKEVIVAHKTADIGYFEHDAGIVYSSKGDYIIVILSESNMPEQAGVRIAEISRDVYKYFND